jgi:TonB-linked SusC/RagA family outer membrane protein
MKHNLLRRTRTNSPGRPLLMQLLFFFAVCLGSGPAFAQQVQKVTGTVIDSTGTTLPGVNIIVEGSGNRGTSTDADGKFELNVNPNATLVVSFIGYQTQRVTISGQSVLNIRLAPMASNLNEVVVVGYQSQERRKLLSSVATISGADINKRVGTNPLTLMQGKLPGLQVVQGSGEPGNEGIQMRVRGITTFSSVGNDPLVIVNGLPGNLTALNPNDIESISVLKDAASAAIYGSRGSNGVIVVKTKKGKAGFALQYNFNIGISTTAKLPETVSNSAEFMELSNEARRNSSLQPLYTQDQIDLYRNATDRVKYPNHNWLDDVFVTAYTKNHFLNLSGGTENTTYNVGFGITDQPGTVIGFDYQKYTVSIGLSSRLNKRVTFGTDLQMRYGNRNAPRSGGGDIFLSTLAQSPLYPAQAPDGRWIASAYPNEQRNKNPVAIAKNDVRIRTLDYYAQGNISLDVDIIDGLRWENRGGATYFSLKNNDFRPRIPMYFYNDMSPAGNLDVGAPGLSVRREDNIYGSLYSQLNFSRKFGLHNLSVLAGAQQEYNTYSELNASRNAFPSNDLRELNAGPADGQSNNGAASEWALRSFYGSLNYDFKDKYLIGGSIRYDGTSRLPANTRWGTFYSVSAAWRLTEEAFLKDVSWLNDMKIRASLGEVGNQNIVTDASNASRTALTPYPYQPVLSLRNYAFSGSVATGYSASTLVDPALRWESTRVFDIGIDVTAFNNKLNITADWYNKYTFDILRTPLIPIWLGLNAPVINDGALRNKGVELNIEYKNRIGNDFSYSIGGNIQTYRNKIESYGTKEIGSNTIREEGRPLDQFYMYVWDGIFQSQSEIDNSPVQPVKPTPGDLKIKDVNNDGKIDPNDRTYVDGRYPSMQYSFNIGANWKGFDLSLQMYGSQGQKIYVNGWGAEPFRQGSVPTTDWRNRWTPENPSTTMPKIYVADSYAPVQNYASTYFLKDASFLRLRGVQLGYTVPLKIISKIGAKSLRIYAVGDNLFMFSKYPGLDPERVSVSGTYVTYPQIKTVTFGASIQF